MGRPKAKAAPQHIEPDVENLTPPPGFETHGVSTVSSRKVSKTDAIRAAVAEGIESPGDGVDFIRKRFGLEMSKGHFSATKSKLKTSEGIGAKKAAPVNAGTTKAVPKGKPLPVEERQSVNPAGGEGELLDLLEKMKPMIAEHGAEKIKRIADLLG